MVVGQDDSLQRLLSNIKINHIVERLERYLSIQVTRGNELGLWCTKELDTQSTSLLGINGNAESL